MFRIFDKNIIAKELFTVNLDSSEIQSVMGGNLFLDHSELNPNNCCVVEQNQEIQYPTYDELEDTVREMTLIERHKNGLYELGEHEVVYNNDILRLEPGQYISQEGELITVTKIEGIRVEWNWKLNEWQDVATELEIAELQYAEYDPLDKPSVIEEMDAIDPSLGKELKGMLIELRGIISSLKEQPTREIVGYAEIHIPEPSKKLEDFKSKFNKFKK